MSIVVILLLLTANFQSVRLALVVVSTTPAVVAGVVVALWLTGTTINLQSFMGAIMAIGVAVANAILLVTFAERHRREDGAEPAEAAVAGRTGPAPADPHDELRHDRRHGPDGAGLERGGRADGAAGPGGHRRPGRRDPGHPARPADRLRPRPGPGRPPVGLARPVRPGEPPLRPEPWTTDRRGRWTPRSTASRHGRSGRASRRSPAASLGAPRASSPLGTAVPPAVRGSSPAQDETAAQATKTAARPAADPGGDRPARAADHPPVHPAAGADRGVRGHADPRQGRRLRAERGRGHRGQGARRARCWPC